jgi:hypothetical protein
MTPEYASRDWGKPQKLSAKTAVAGLSSIQYFRNSKL